MAAGNIPTLRDYRTHLFMALRTGALAAILAAVIGMGCAQTTARSRSWHSDVVENRGTTASGSGMVAASGSGMGSNAHASGSGMVGASGSGMGQKVCEPCTEGKPCQDLTSRDCFATNANNECKASLVTVYQVDCRGSGMLGSGMVSVNISNAHVMAHASESGMVSNAHASGSGRDEQRAWKMARDGASGSGMVSSTHAETASGKHYSSGDVNNGSNANATVTPSDAPIGTRPAAGPTKGVKGSGQDGSRASASNQSDDANTGRSSAHEVDGGEKGHATHVVVSASVGCFIGGIMTVALVGLAWRHHTRTRGTYTSNPFSAAEMAPSSNDDGELYAGSHHAQTESRRTVSVPTLRVVAIRVLSCLST